MTLMDAFWFNCILQNVIHADSTPLFTEPHEHNDRWYCGHGEHEATYYSSTQPASGFVEDPNRWKKFHNTFQREIGARKTWTGSYSSGISADPKIWPFYSTKLIFSEWCYSADEKRYIPINGSCCDHSISIFQKLEAWNAMMRVCRWHHALSSLLQWALGLSGSGCIA